MYASSSINTGLHFKLGEGLSNYMLSPSKWSYFPTPALSSRPNWKQQYHSMKEFVFWCTFGRQRRNKKRTECQEGAWFFYIENDK